MYYTLFALFLALVFLAVPSVSLAQTPTCTIIYGGGEMECDATVSVTTKPTATPKPAQPATGSGQTTKGGLPVHEPTNPTTTPDTGPETFALISLIPAAAAGLYLRRKTK